MEQPPKTSHSSTPHLSSRVPGGAAAVDLYWLPLGAGGRVVRFSGRLYERILALRGRRAPLDLYHAALEVHLPEGRFVIELTPIADRNGAARGVVSEGPVGSRRLGRFRLFRYELHCWRDGVIPDIGYAIASPQRVTDDRGEARRLLDSLASVPSPVWGRDELRTGEMWNSNSVIAWLLARNGLLGSAVQLPANGRAPGWDAGLTVAHRQQATTTA